MAPRKQNVPAQSHTHVSAGELHGIVKDGRRVHAVELANLRRALQHLDRVLVCKRQIRIDGMLVCGRVVAWCGGGGRVVRTIRDLKGHRGEGSQATEAARLKAGLARLKVGDRAVAALDEADL